MTEERINSAAETIHSANKLSITKGILSVVAAEAREEARKGGIESVKLNSIRRIIKHKERCSESGYPLGEFTEGLEVGIKVIIEEAERLKEKGR